jgi:sugar phosphate isomerase/epimerase|tara:strand:- start:1568 stop:2323 length:756 start_codon:yes stop_codon:yes gene_type:complete
MKSFSYQLYSSRNFPPLENTLQMLSNAGYAEVEGYDELFTHSTDLGAFRAMLDNVNLRMTTAHFNLHSVRTNPKRVIEIAKSLDILGIYVPYLEAEARPENALGWIEFGKSLSEAGKPIVDAGLTFGWHNHEYEFVDIGATDRPMDLILAADDSLSLEFDLAWAVVAGVDPMHWISLYGDRITATHIKDIAKKPACVDNTEWADIGYGTLDWPQFYLSLKRAGTRFFIMEHDNPIDDEKFAQLSITTARKF